MAIKTAPIEALAPTPKKPRKATEKAVQAAPASISIPSSPEPVETVAEAPSGRKRSGFASMSKDVHRQASARGGAAQPADKRYFALNKDAARLAGSKGGKHSPKKETAQ
jgi:general stress protein YciG